MINTFPRRRTTLQFSQILFTLVRTFIVLSSCNRICAVSFRSIILPPNGLVTTRGQKRGECTNA